MRKSNTVTKKLKSKEILERRSKKARLIAQGGKNSHKRQRWSEGLRKIKKPASGIAQEKEKEERLEEGEIRKGRNRGSEGWGETCWS